MSTSIRKQQRKEKVLEWAMRPHWMPRDVNGRLISHDHLRFYEKGFPKLAYFEGVPFVPWRALQAKVLKPHGWDQFQGHFRGEHLIVGDNGLKTMSHANIYGEGNHTYLKLEDVLPEERLYHATSSLLHDWENGSLHAEVTSNPDRPYAVHHRAKFGFSRFTVYNSEGRSTETFSFNEKTLLFVDSRRILRNTLRL